MVADYRWTHRPGRLAWFKGWWPSGAQSAFIIFYYDIFVLTVHAFVDSVTVTFRVVYE